MDAGWIAVAALLVAVATAIAEGLSRRRQHHLAQEQLDLAKRLGAIEQRRREEEVEKRKQANVIAHFERRDKDAVSRVLLLRITVPQTRLTWLSRFGRLRQVGQSNSSKSGVRTTR
jgi:hypothetical protein